METCHYCGQQAHPLPVWQKGTKFIHVCSIKVEVLETEDGPDLRIEDSDCPARARADGYTPRPDLTPKR